ncbi:hypothetical protein DSO57_1001489 [Entomophthora muscae]|uniref:Uncharacterized protein n=1 Tax=Entomophthora muscae TaxID=34485 RepID=A0ACC2UTZ0_9FUNG|nr:hypothetical protein DSO57_1001489 [Entomophthora muscae]
MTPEVKPVRTNDQPIQDGPPRSQTTVPENPKNDHEEANQTAEPVIPSLATQLAPEEFPEALALLCWAPGDNIQENTAGNLYNKRFEV